MRIALTTPARTAIDGMVLRRRSSERTLDLGAGPSRYAAFFPNRVALDVSPKAGIQVVASASNLPFQSETFPLVLCTEVLEHLPDPRAAIAEIRRVLKPGGQCILSTRFCYPIHDAPTDFYRFTRYGLEHLFSGWHIDEISADGSFLSTLLPLMNARVSRSSRALRPVATAAWLPLAALLGAIARRQHSTDSDVAAGYFLVATKPEGATAR